MNAMASNSSFIVTAYAVTWIAVLLYAWRLHRHLARARLDFERATRESKSS